MKSARIVASQASPPVLPSPDSAADFTLSLAIIVAVAIFAWKLLEAREKFQQKVLSVFIHSYEKNLKDLAESQSKIAEVLARMDEKIENLLHRK
jgi:heme A synthase